MSERPISPLRHRMLEDRSVRRFTPIRNASTSEQSRGSRLFLGRSPDSATPEELRSFQTGSVACGRI
jgi:hypothetical protein